MALHAVDTDSSEDFSIHRIKDGNPAAGAKSIIEKRTAALLREHDPFDSDSDKSCSDGALSFPSEDEVQLY